MSFVNKAPNAITAFPTNMLFYRGANTLTPQKDGPPKNNFDT